MIKLPLFYDLQGNLVTEQGEKVDAHFKDVSKAKEFCEKYKALYDFRGVLYSLHHVEQEHDERTTIGRLERYSR